MPIEFKKCPKCQSVKPRTAYWLRKKGKSLLASRCIDCMKASSRMYKIRPVVTADEKFCPKCKVIKLRSDFHRSSRTKDGSCGHCKACHAVYTANYRRSEKGQKRIRQWTREYQQSPEARTFMRSRKLEREFGITLEIYEQRLAEQNGVCAICGKEPNGQNLCVDHCHDTDAIRGLLCRKCNSAIGLLGDCPEVAKSAFEYLSKHR